MVKEKTYKTLIISPHMDDEVYGCSSYLKDGGDTFIFYVTTNHPLFPDGENVKENEVLAEHLNIRSQVMYPEDRANRVDLLGQSNEPRSDRRGPRRLGYRAGRNVHRAIARGRSARRQ